MGGHPGPDPQLAGRAKAFVDIAAGKGFRARTWHAVNGVSNFPACTNRCSIRAQ